MTQTINGSAYPLPVDELLPRARELAKELGEVPSRNRLMSELRIGAPKAQALREKLQHEDEAYGLWMSTGHISTDDYPAPHLYPDPIGPAPADAPDATWPAYKRDERVDKAWQIWKSTGQVPTADDLVQRLGIEHAEARKISGLVDVAARFSAHRAAQVRPAPDPGRSAEPGGSEPSPGHPGLATPVDGVQPVKVNNLPPLVTTHGHPGTAPAPARRRKTRTWPVWLLALPAFVAIWSGWVGLGSLTGFGVVHPLPGIADGVELDTAILLPIGVETYGAFALRVWMSGHVPARARRFARASAIGSLLLGGLGQVAYHLMTAQGWHAAPWWITTAVSCLPVAVLGMGAALAHLLRTDES